MESEPAEPRIIARHHGLALALLEGDSAAPAVAVRVLTPIVRRIVARFFELDADIEDVVQEVFLRLFSRIQTLVSQRR